MICPHDLEQLKMFGRWKAFMLISTCMPARVWNYRTENIQTCKIIISIVFWNLTIITVFEFEHFEQNTLQEFEVSKTNIAEREQAV